MMVHDIQFCKAFAHKNVAVENSEKQKQCEGQKNDMDCHRNCKLLTKTYNMRRELLEPLQFQYKTVVVRKIRPRQRCRGVLVQQRVIGTDLSDWYTASARGGEGMREPQVLCVEARCWARISILYIVLDLLIVLIVPWVFAFFLQNLNFPWE